MKPLPLLRSTSLLQRTQANDSSPRKNHHKHVPAAQTHATTTATPRGPPLEKRLEVIGRESRPPQQQHARELSSEAALAMRHEQWKLAQTEAMNDIRRVHTFANQQVGHFDETYGKVLDKLSELEATASRFSKLQEMATQLLEDFETNDAKFHADMKAQIRKLEDLKAEMGAIEFLQKRLETQRQIVEVYKGRLDRVQEKIEKQKQMEVIWRQRASRRLKILWGVISVLVIFWLLFATVDDSSHVGLVKNVQISKMPDSETTTSGALPRKILSTEAEILLRDRHLTL